jgi:uncharacterized membrane protein YoaK (UPF0700 family)
MLSSRAYSFRQKCRLAISLSWIGGYVNVMTLLACGSYVSNVSGNVTFIGQLTIDRDHGRALFFAFAAASFFLGTIVSGVLLETARRRGYVSKYVIPVAVELVLLSIFGICVEIHGPGDPVDRGFWHFSMVAMSAIAMGVQNATMTSISGAVVRTTHVTGVVTDLGLEGVQFSYWLVDLVKRKGVRDIGGIFRSIRRHPPAQRLVLLASIFGSFLLGAIFGAGLFANYEAYVAYPPIAFLAWIIFVDVRSPIADMRELDPHNDPELKKLAMIKALQPNEVGVYRLTTGGSGRKHRAPDFQHWLDRVSPRFRVVILAVDPTIVFDQNAVLDFEAAVGRLHADGRKLILSGVTPHQLEALKRGGITSKMEVANICPDLESAVTRSLPVLRQLESEPRRNSTSTASFPLLSAVDARPADPAETTGPRSA